MPPSMGPYPWGWRQVWPHLPTGNSANPAVSCSPSLTHPLSAPSQRRFLTAQPPSSHTVLPQDSVSGWGEPPQALLLPFISVRFDIPVALPSPHILLVILRASQPLSADWLPAQGNWQRNVSCEPDEGGQRGKIHRPWGVHLPQVGPAARVVGGSWVRVFTIPSPGSWELLNQCLSNK